jgi:phospholipid/cholesterol/gamma-HCH transport system substrate-binding protein
VSPLRRVPALLRALAVAALVGVVAGLVLLWPGEPRTRVTAHFSRAVGLYPGSEVRILGVPVGEVLEVHPEGETVRVVLEYDAAQRVPADAKAAVVSPSLVADRFVQLLPAYTGGPAMTDGAEIPVERTAVPVELDRVSASLDELMVALGPDGANSSGALTRLLRTGAENLDGQGEQLGATVRDLSLALEAVAGSDDDLFTTVRNLQRFTTTLAAGDDQVRQLNRNLATVSDQLAGERDDLALALHQLAVALDEVSTFVRDNRTVLRDDVAGLEEVTASVVAQQEAFAETLANAPIALSNLGNTYNPRSGTLDTRMDLGQQHDPGLFLCSLVSGATRNGEYLGRPQLCAPGSPMRSVLTALDPLLDISGLPLLPGGAP